VYGVPFVPQHTPEFILAECHVAGKTGIFLFHGHALDRRGQRKIGRLDVRSALGGATTAEFQPDNGRWKVTGGADLDGVPVSVIVVYARGLLVITVF
jgi:hypothetical protein